MEVEYSGFLSAVSDQASHILRERAELTELQARIAVLGSKLGNPSSSYLRSGLKTRGQKMAVDSFTREITKCQRPLKVCKRQVSHEQGDLRDTRDKTNRTFARYIDRMHGRAMAGKTVTKESLRSAKTPYRSSQRSIARVEKLHQATAQKVDRVQAHVEEVESTLNEILLLLRDVENAKSGASKKQLKQLNAVTRKFGGKHAFSNVLKKSEGWSIQDVRDKLSLKRDDGLMNLATRAREMRGNASELQMRRSALRDSVGRSVSDSKGLQGTGGQIRQELEECLAELEKLSFSEADIATSYRNVLGAVMHGTTVSTSDTEAAVGQISAADMQLNMLTAQVRTLQKELKLLPSVQLEQEELLFTLDKEIELAKEAIKNVSPTADFIELVDAHDALIQMRSKVENTTFVLSVLKGERKTLDIRKGVKAIHPRIVKKHPKFKAKKARFSGTDQYAKGIAQEITASERTFLLQAAKYLAFIKDSKEPRLLKDVEPLEKAIFESKLFIGRSTKNVHSAYSRMNLQDYIGSFLNVTEHFMDDTMVFGELQQKKGFKRLEKKHFDTMTAADFHSPVFQRGARHPLLMKEFLEIDSNPSTSAVLAEIKNMLSMLSSSSE